MSSKGDINRRGRDGEGRGRMARCARSRQESAEQDKYGAETVGMVHDIRIEKGGGNWGTLDYDEDNFH
jgi:hypothetical protein